MSDTQSIWDTDLEKNMMEGESPFRGKLLLAMPSLQDGFFDKSVVYICAHSAAGAMGIVINQKLNDVRFNDLLEQLDMPQSRLNVAPVIHFGGPVETGRGFVLHSTDFLQGDTVRLQDGMCITGTIDILRAISEGKGPRQSLFALGYAGWGPGQLEAEVQENSWLTLDADMELVFDTNLAGKWDLALSRLGISPEMLSMTGGKA